MHIAQKLGYIGVFESLKPVTNSEVTMSASMNDEKYRNVAPEAMHETFMSDSEEEGEFRAKDNYQNLVFCSTSPAFIKLQKEAFAMFHKKDKKTHLHALNSRFIISL